MAESASLIRDVEQQEKMTSASSPSSASPSQKAWKKVGLVLVPLALLAVAYQLLKPTDPVTGGSKKNDLGSTVELTASTWWDPITQCTKDFQEVMDDGLGTFAFGEFDYETQQLKMKDIKTAKQAAEALQDPNTNFVHVGNCGYDKRAVVWLYPDHTGDPSSAFLMANGECKRLTVQFLDIDDRADCVAVYRVKSPAWGEQALNHFHGPNTVTHCVVGGHGSDSTMEDGVLVMSSMIYLSGKHSVDSMALVDTLHTKLTPHATVFLDSCFAGINGVAKMFSEKMPEHWVAGKQWPCALHLTDDTLP